MTDPPYRLTTDRLVVRCWDPADAPLLKDAIDSSVEHLREWMPWAHDEPQALEQKVALLRHFRGSFDLGHDFVYGIFSPDEAEVVGGTGLHTRGGTGAFEIGYWVRVDRTRQGIATDAAAALTRAAFDVCGVDRVEIHVDPDNQASLGVPRKLGFVEEATLRRRLPANSDGGPPRDKVVFTLFRDDVGATPVGALRLEGFDATGARIL